MKQTKRITAALAVAVMLFLLAIPGVLADDDVLMTSSVSLAETGAETAEMPFAVDCRGAVLIDTATGTVLCSYHADEPFPPASVTKVITLLLTMEAIEKGQLQYDQMLSASEYAASMGGSQIYLKAGEEMSVEDLLKSVIVSSANDAAVVLAENVAGSEESFVARMNERARELGMTTASFENVTGLDDDTVNHVLSAMDIAICSRELLRHSKILEYSGIWMDTIRGGAFGLTNTNRLIRFYSGATGLKTGSTAKAKFCISATAERDGLSLIAVVMGAPDRDTRNEIAKKMLDWGFANYCLYKDDGGECGSVPVLGGTADYCKCSYRGDSFLLGKGKDKNVETTVSVPEKVAAPVKAGDKIGEVIYTLDGEELGRADVVAAEEVPKIGFFGNLFRILSLFLLR